MSPASTQAYGGHRAIPAPRHRRLMWFDDIDVGGRGIVRPAVGPLGRALRTARLDVLLSQQRLAESAGVSQGAVSRLELGAPNWKLFCKLIDILGGQPVVTIQALPTLADLEAKYGDLSSLR